MLKFPLFAAAADSRRGQFFPPSAIVALFGAILLLAFASISSPASAEPYCERAEPAADLLPGRGAAGAVRHPS